MVKHTELRKVHLVIQLSVKIALFTQQTVKGVCTNQGYAMEFYMKQEFVCHGKRKSLNL